MTVQGRSARIAARRRWAQSEEIDWVHSQEIRWVQSQEIGWAQSEEILQYGNTRDPQLVVYCESRVKALVTSVANADWLCAGLTGVDGWSAGKDKEDVIIPAENLIPPLETDDLPAVLLPDSHHHKQVRRAMAGLTTALKRHYRSVTLAKLPDPPDGRPDWGADDVAATYGSPAVLNLFVREAPDTDTFTLESAAEIVARQPPQWVVRDLIPTEELTLIVGETNCGKTFLAMDLLLAVARPNCSHWLGNKIRIHGPVVHISLEGRSLPNRIRAYLKHHGITAPPDYHAIGGNVTLAQDYARLAQTLDALQPTVIAVDTVNRALGGGDENSSTDMGAFIRAAEQLVVAFPGCAVILVHHLGKDVGKGARGHSSLRGAVGAELLVTHDKPTGVRTVTLGKQRDGAMNFAASFMLGIVELGHDEDGDLVTSCVVQAVAPPASADASDYEVYVRIWQWNRTEYGGKPVSREVLRRNRGRILGDLKLTKEAFFDAVEGAINRGWIRTRPADRGRGESLELSPPPERKF